MHDHACRTVVDSTEDYLRVSLRPPSLFTSSKILRCAPHPSSTLRSAPPSPLPVDFLASIYHDTVVPAVVPLPHTTPISPAKLVRRHEACGSLKSAKTVLRAPESSAEHFESQRNSRSYFDLPRPAPAHAAQDALSLNITLHQSSSNCVPLWLHSSESQDAAVHVRIASPQH